MSFTSKARAALANPKQAFQDQVASIQYSLSDLKDDTDEWEQRVRDAGLDPSKLAKAVLDPTGRKYRAGPDHVRLSSLLFEHLLIHPGFLCGYG